MAGESSILGFNGGFTCSNHIRSLCSTEVSEAARDNIYNPLKEGVLGLTEQERKSALMIMESDAYVRSILETANHKILRARGRIGKKA